MSGRAMNWGAPKTTETASPDSDSDLYRKLWEVALFGNSDELWSWIDYNACCMLDSEPEKLSDDELNQATTYTDGFAMKFLAEFAGTEDLPDPFSFDHQGICIGTDMFMECVIAEADSGPTWKTYLMATVNDLDVTIYDRQAVGFYGEITKHGSQFGFFHGWQCDTSLYQVQCHRFLPADDYQNMIDYRYQAGDKVKFYQYFDFDQVGTVYEGKLALLSAI